MGTQIRYSCYHKNYAFLCKRNTITSPCWAWKHQEGLANSLKYNIIYIRCSAHARHWRPFVTKAKRSSDPMKDETISRPRKKGTIVGAVALIIGTSIGSGILALPKKTSPAGFIPSATSMVLCWGFLLIEALLLSELNVSMLNRRKKKKEDEDKLELISITTMAQETLGLWGGTLATLNYIFLAYTSMVAYTSKSGEILSELTNLPPSVSGLLFTFFFTLLIFLGGTRLTDQINQWLTACMIGLLVGIEVLGAVSGEWSELTRRVDWAKMPLTVSVIIFALVYHDLTPVICTYLDGDIKRIRVSLVVGSLVPLVAMLVWDAVALSLSNADSIDPVDLLMRVKGSGVSKMVEAFSLLAVGTSLLGTILGFSQFLLEQLNSYTSHPDPTRSQQDEFERQCKLLVQRKENSLGCDYPSSNTMDPIKKQSAATGWENWWVDNKISLAAMVMVVAPPLFISNSIPDAFSTTTDIAGGYCMAMLYGVLPPAMAWAMYGKTCNDDDNDQKKLSRTKPALVGAGLFACGVVLEQMLQDLSFLNL